MRPQDERKEPQEQVKINHKDGVDLGKMKKTKRGGRARHLMLNQDAMIVSKNQDKKRNLAHI